MASTHDPLGVTEADVKTAEEDPLAALAEPDAKAVRGAIMRYQRRLSGLTSAEAARQLGVSRMVFSYWESGQHGIPEWAMEKIKKIKRNA